MDIKDFFYSIDSVQVKEMFEDTPFNYNREIATILAMLTTYKNALPVGAATSPVISNFIFAFLLSVFNHFEKILVNIGTIS